MNVLNERLDFRSAFELSWGGDDHETPEERLSSSQVPRNARLPASFRRWEGPGVAQAAGGVEQREVGMASLDLPYRCPRCGEHKRFHSLSSLRAHLEYSHTYETLYVLSKPSGPCDGALVPLVGPAGGLQDVLAAKDRRFPYELQCAEDLGLGAARYIPDLEFPLGEIFAAKDAAPTGAAPASPGTAVAVATSAVVTSAVEAAYEEGLARLRARALGKLDLEERLERLSEEVEQRIAARVGRLQAELERKSSELEKPRQESVRLGQEKQELEDKATELSRQVDVSVEMLAALKQDLVDKEQELTNKQQ